MKLHRSTAFAFLTLSVAACGGGANPAAKDPSKTAGDAKPEEHTSIGDIAAAQGGLAALGGAGNREEGSGTESAMTGPLRAEEVDKKKPVKLDGMLKEWHARSSAHETLSGKTDGVTLDVAMQYDDTKLYVGAQVADPKLARSGKAREGDDHLSFVIAFPSARGALAGYEIGLWPGKPGESTGSVKWLSGPNKGQDVAGSKLVEADEKGGFTLEASIPWSSFVEARTMRVGLRGVFRYHDGDGSETRGVIATGGGQVDKPTDLPPLPTASEQAVVDGLLNQKNLAGEKPKIDLYVDITGDDRKERVSVWGRFFTICGPGYRGGHQFFWREVAGDIVGVEPRELTGRGKEDLVVRRRVLQPTAVHEIAEVWSLGSGDEPKTVFASQVAIASNDGKKKVTNGVRISSKEIEVATEPATGWDASSFKETIPSDIDPILLPWGAVKSRTYRFEKEKFAVVSEVPQTPTAPAGGGAVASTSGDKTGPERDLPTPQVKKGSDLSKQVLEAYFKDQSVAAGTKPKVDLEVHVDGDAKPERVLLVGRDIVVLGPAFKNGAGYARMSLTQFADAADVTEVTARDVTGDGAAEIIVRGVRRVSAPSGDKIDVDALFVYRVTGGNIARIFAVETGREVSGKRVQGLVQFVPAKGQKSFDIDVRPGAAKGWTEATYPWPQDKPGGSIEPLLLPWGKIPSLRYTWSGSEFTRAN